MFFLSANMYGGRACQELSAGKREVKGTHSIPLRAYRLMEENRAVKKRFKCSVTEGLYRKQGRAGEVWIWTKYLVTLENDSFF